jgi:CheY-like chemotaxis protein
LSALHSAASRDSKCSLCGYPLPRLGIPDKRHVSPAAGTEAASHVMSNAPKNLNILVVEDNPVNLRLVVRLLEKKGHRTLTAANGREAVEILQKAGWQGIDLALMDLQMPELDGFEATAVIREREKALGSHLPIIAVTAHALEGYSERCLNAGMNGFVTKPVHASELFAAIQNVLCQVIL